MGGWINSLWIPKITILMEKDEKRKKFNMKYTVGGFEGNYSWPTGVLLP